MSDQFSCNRKTSTTGPHQSVAYDMTLTPWRWLTSGMFCLLVALLACHKIYDPDFWLHLATGREMLEKGVVIRSNYFSFTHPDHEWLNVYWLYQVTLAWIWSQAGAVGTLILKVGLNLALALLMVRGVRLNRGPLQAGEWMLAVMGWLAMAPRLGDRPELLSFVLLAAMLALLQHGWWWWCVPLQMIWANVQGYYYWGPILVLLVLAEAWHAGDRLKMRKVWPVLFAMVAACMVSPFGWRNLLLAVGFASTMGQWRGQIDELVSPLHPAIWQRDGSSFVLLGYMFIVMVLMVKARKALNLRDGILIVVAATMTLLSRRAAPIFVLMSLPTAWRAMRLLQLPDSRMAWISVLMSIGILGGSLATGGIGVQSQANARQFGVGANTARLPWAAADWLVATSQHEPSMRVMNVELHTGGYLNWHWHGRLATFVDGRLEAYPEEMMNDYLHITEDRAALNRLVYRYGVTHVLLVCDRSDVRRLDGTINVDGTWREVYRDQLATVWKKVP